jgi:hypothetical protein
MALPTLDATFASVADLPRRYMLAQWLVNELGSGSIADYYDLPERYLWAKIAVAAGGTKDEAAYIGLPKQYAWKDIYDAVSGSSFGTIDWVEKQALGHIAAAYRGDTANPANLATYIDWPWRYQVASIIGGINPAFPSNGLLAFWKLGDETDSSGNGNTLTNDGVTFSSGKIGNCAQFDGTAGGLILGSFSSSFDSNSPYTISLWYNVTTIKNYFSLVGCNNAETLNIHGSLGGRLDINNSSVEDFSVEDFFTAGSWNHFVATRNSSSQIAVWRNGVKIQESASTQTYGNVPFLNIGNLDTSDILFAMNGKIDAVGIWQRELNESEISSLYNNSNGLEP